MAPITMSSVLRPHQNRVIAEVDRAIVDGYRRIVVMAPTGFGKTIVGAVLTEKIRVGGGRTIFTVPALSLIDQTVEKFWAEGLRDVGVMQANHVLTNYARPVQIASVQTLARREIPDANLVIMDEIHRWFDFYGDWLREPRWVDVPFIGM